jgi:hypothetical protein
MDEERAGLAARFSLFLKLHCRFRVFSRPGKEHAMKKLAAIAALTAALATPAAAQYVYSPYGGNYGYEPRGYDEIYVYGAPPVYGSQAPLITPRGVMSDPDPNIRSEIRRHYNHYMYLNGG